jgi:uncharacterized cupredoxin-like copper-binding protein
VTGRAGALVLGLVAALAPASRAAAVDWSQAQLVTVIAADYRFEPNRLDFRRGVAYRLHLVNSGKEMHEFTAAAFFRAVDIGNPEALNPDHTELVVQPGEQQDLYFTPREPGDFPLACADHDWAGMTGEITIE